MEILLSICFFILLYLTMLSILPIYFFVGIDGLDIAPCRDSSNLYVLKVHYQTVPIPSYQWRDIETDIMILPFGVFKIFNKQVFLFGEIGYRIYALPEVKMKGLEILNTIKTSNFPDPITVIATNYSPRSPYILRYGDDLAHLELFRVSYFRIKNL